MAKRKWMKFNIYMHLICAPCESIHFVVYGFAWGTSVYLVEKQNRNLPNVKVLLHQILEFFSLLGHITNNNRKVSMIWTELQVLVITIWVMPTHTSSSSISSSFSGTSGGLKKLKKLSHFSVLIIGFAFFAPFFGFFFKTFWVKLFPGSHSISVLQDEWHATY